MEDGDEGRENQKRRGGVIVSDSNTNTKRQATHATSRQQQHARPEFRSADIMLHVLFDDDLELVRRICVPSALRVQAESSGPTNIVRYTRGCLNMTVMRSLFFILLQADPQLRCDVVSAAFCGTVMTAHGRPAPACPHKATRFFQHMRDDCIHVWLRNGQHSALEMVESIKMLYVCS